MRQRRAPIRIVPMEVQDIPHVVAIERQSFVTPWNEDCFEAELEGFPYAYSWVALPKGRPDAVRAGAPRRGASSRVSRRVLGYLCAWVGGNEVHLLNVAVHPDRRRQGIATFLLRAMLREGQRLGAGRVSLEVRASNEAAHRLYKGLGFRVVRTQHQYYQRPTEDALIMQRDIMRTSFDTIQDEIRACG